MGREVRRVPADWVHPRDDRGSYISLHGDSFSQKIAHWKLSKEKWEQGFREDVLKDGEWVPLDKEERKITFEEWNGNAPEEADYMPDWPAEKRTHYQMYETTSEGTPISPVMETPEQLAEWLANSGASSFANMTATYEQWLTVCKGKSSVSAAIIDGEMISGVELNKLDEENPPVHHKIQWQE